MFYQAVCWFKFDTSMKSRSNLFEVMPFKPAPDRPVKPTGLTWCLRLLTMVHEKESNLYCFIALMKENKEARPVRAVQLIIFEPNFYFDNYIIDSVFMGS